MRAVLISLQPKWCKEIFNIEGYYVGGQPFYAKGLEIRKSKPKLETPFKVLIYCTNSKPILGRCLIDNSLKETSEIDFDNYNRDTLFKANGKVIGEFICNDIAEFKVYENGTVQYWNWHNLYKSCLTYDELASYIGNGKKGYAWKISNRILYDKPKELSEFEKPREYIHINYRKRNSYFKGITRPPQSWCYVEMVGDSG